MSSRRKQRLEAQIGIFVRQYARKHYPNIDPNDRRYDREIEALVKRMSPEELDELMNEADDDTKSPPPRRPNRAKWQDSAG